MDPIVIALVSGILALLLAWFFAMYVLRQPEGTDKMKEISAAIREGANAFLGREYRILAILVVVIGIILSVIPNLGIWAGLSFAFGAVSSMAAGYFGMAISTRSNNRTAAAVIKGLNQGLMVAFRGGTVMGMVIVGIGVIGLSILYFVFHQRVDFLTILPAYGMGASGVALFARVGGGIFTKAADSGADMVGKVEKGIPEDDPRNAAVIADFVGDNVGDCAGAGADLFESYVESIIATMALSSAAVLSLRAGGPLLVPNKETAWFLPMMVAAGGIIASIIGVFFVRVGKKTDMKALLGALRNGTWIASILAVVFSWMAVYFLKADMGVFWAILSGLLAGVFIGEATNYYTSYAYRPVVEIAESAKTGTATLIISGLANGLMSNVAAVILVAIAIVVSFRFAGMYGVAISGIGMLATLGIFDATDAYGPIADNAGGIAEMSGLPPETREKTDALDSLGNTTKATAKGFAIASAALTALGLLLSYTVAVGIKFEEISLLDARVVAGIFLGAMLPAIFTAMTMKSVGRTAFAIINEVRRQFREIPGIMDYPANPKGRPEYGKCVDICTKAALKEMLAPSIIALVVPVLVGIVLGKVALGGFLMGATATGFILGITLANAGGSWDNAKKYIETGAMGGKGSDAHKSAVVGDAVGDPMKDTSGPAMNIMIKLMSIVALVLAPVLINMTGLF